jgi:hypothetical protein
MKIEDARPPDGVDRDAALVHLLQRVWTYPLTTKSNDARAFADEISEGASRQLITTQIVPGPRNTIWGRIWKVTPTGLTFLWDHADLLTFEEVRYVEAYCTH